MRYSCLTIGLALASGCKEDVQCQVGGSPTPTSMGHYELTLPGRSTKTNETDRVAGFAIGSPEASPIFQPAGDQFRPPVLRLHLVACRLAPDGQEV